MSEDLQIAAEGGIATATINRPTKLNALNRAIWAGLRDAMAALDFDPAIKVVVITGAGGKAFSAGADMSEFAEVYRTPEATRAYNALTREALDAVYGLGKPVIAMIDGLCIGGGCGLAMACDLRIASARSRFAVTPARIGAAYAFSDTKLLVDLVGPARAKHILFSGEQLSAETAFAFGLVDRVVPAEDLDGNVRGYAENLCSLSQRSIRVAKQMVRAIVEGTDQETEALRRLSDDTFAEADFREGYDAFLSKRKPKFR